jgi:hypothetical protein
MATRYPELNDKLRAFIGRQHIFFTASAAPGSRVNVSPRSTAELRVLGARSLAYLDLTGSGNETAAHIRAGGNLTMMFCAFDGPPMILRLYGTGRIVARHTPEYGRMLADEFAGAERIGARQIVMLDVSMVQTSCGYGVPTFDYTDERPSLDNWAAAKGEDGLIAYRQEKNRFSIDGLPTGLPDADPVVAPERSQA